MKTYTREEKIKAGEWVQKWATVNGHCWQIHYIENDTEYFVQTPYYTKKNAIESLKIFRENK